MASPGPHRKYSPCMHIPRYGITVVWGDPSMMADVMNWNLEGYDTSRVRIITSS